MAALLRWTFSLVVILGLAVAPAAADNRLAFVVGIDAYPHLAADAQLQRAVADATAVGNALNSLGFVVSLVSEDATLNTLLSRFETFKSAIRSGDTVVFYFAGHGISLDDGNYLIPADIPQLGPSDERLVKHLAIPEHDFGQDIRSAGARVAVVVIDACRNNPFPAHGTRSLGGGGRGLIRMSPAEGLFSLYSAREGQVALDRLSDRDADRNSVFTRVFLKALTTPGINLSELGDQVRDQVADLAQANGQDQVPAVYNDLRGARSVFLGGPAPAVVPLPAPLVVAALPPPVGQPLSSQTRGYVLPPDATLVPQDDETIKESPMSAGAPTPAPITISNSVEAAAFAPDGRTALSGNDSTLKLWDLSSGALVKTFVGHNGGILSVAFAPDGRMALSGSSDTTLKLWDVAAGRLIRTFEGHADEVYSVAFAPDGRMALSGSKDKTLKLWDVATGRLIRTFEGHADEVYSVAFAPDGRMALSGSKDKTLKLWDVATGRLVRTFEGHKDAVEAVAFASDGHKALSGSADGTVKVWDFDSGHQIRTFGGRDGAVQAIALAPNGGTMLAGKDHGTLDLWDVASGRLIGTFATHADAVESVAFAPDGHTAVSANFNALRVSTVDLWRVDTGSALATFYAVGANWAAVAGDGRYVGSGDLHKLFHILRDSTELPLDDFLRFNRRDSLSEALSAAQ